MSRQVRHASCGRQFTHHTDTTTSTHWFSALDTWSNVFHTCPGCGGDLERALAIGDLVEVPPPPPPANQMKLL